MHISSSFLHSLSNPGPLFNFDVHDDVRLLSDATVEKDEVRERGNEGEGKVAYLHWTPGLFRPLH